MKLIVKRTSLITLCSLVILSSCTKQEDFTPTFSANVLETTSTSAKISASISSDKELESQGLIYSQYNDLSVVANDGYGYYYAHYERGIIDLDLFSSSEFNITGLQASTGYFFRLFAVNDGIIKESEVYSFTTDCPGLGCGPAGGMIIWVDGAGGGIEVALNYTADTHWGCYGTSVSTGTGIGDGQINTTEILNDCGTTTLAQQCENYTQNGYSDYYMPSKDEMQLIYDKVFIEAENPYYWPLSNYYSSSESDVNNAWLFSASSGTWSAYYKNYYYYATIPIRNF